MQPIERYGLVTLLFIIVAVVAIVAWDGPKEVSGPDDRVARLDREVGDALTRQGLPVVDPGPARRRSTDSIASGERGNGLRSADQPGTRPQPVATDRGSAAAEAARHNPFGTSAPRGDDVVVIPPPAAPSGLAGVPTFQSGESRSGGFAFEANALDAAAGTGVDRVGMNGATPPPANQPANQPAVNSPRAVPTAAPPAVATRSLPTGPLVVDSVLSTQLQREYGRSYRLFGSNGLVQAFVDANPGIDVDRLGVGDTLRRPASARIARASQSGSSTQVASAPAATPAPAATATRPVAPLGDGIVYTIRQNDTLSGIASAALGSASAYKQIEALNPSLVPERLRVGDRIVLPASANLAALGQGSVASNATPVSVVSNSISGAAPRVR